MIDWLKVRFDYRPSVEEAGRLYGGEVVIIEADGSVKWRKVKAFSMEGSHCTFLQVGVDSFTGCLQVDGNPAKYFQGHNVFGTWNVRGLALATFIEVCGKLDIPTRASDLARVAAGEFEVLRVDLTESFDCGSLQRARSVLESISMHGHMRQSRHGKGLLDQGTLYYRKRSRRWAAKAYCKGQEVASRRIITTFPEAHEVYELAQSLLRVEFVVRAMELKTRRLHRGRAWCDSTPQAVFREMLAKLEMPMTHELPSVALDALPTKLRAIYVAWKAGEDIRLLCSRPTFYRYRRDLRAFGIDISIRQPKEFSNVVPLVQLIELRPLGVPARFVGTKAYFDPALVA